MRRALALLALFTLAACGGAEPEAAKSPATPATTPAVPSQSPTPEPSPTPKTVWLPVGGKATVTTSATYDITVKAAKWSTAPCRGGQPPSRTYMMVDVVVTVAAGTGTVNPSDFRLVDISGATTEALQGLRAGCASFGGELVPAGTTHAGVVVYDVGRGPALLEFVPDVAVLASWEIPG